MLLNGWKEIASYLRSGVRTVQRWEDEGLPIIRPRGGSGHVVAYADRLDLWVKRPNGKSTAEMHAMLDQIERNQTMIATLHEQRKLLSSRLADLRRELALLRAKRLKVLKGR